MSPVPLIAVRPLDRKARPVAKSGWRTTDAVPSWSWRGKEGVKAIVEVFFDADEVELTLNGRTIGRKRGGRNRNNVARFTVRYAPGEVTAIAYRSAVETGQAPRGSRTDGDLEWDVREMVAPATAMRTRGCPDGCTRREARRGDTRGSQREEDTDPTGFEQAVCVSGVR
jgi:hypothetical protein